jgi:deoxyribodipyrimidine photo-lyase
VDRLEQHRHDKRPAVYTAEQLEAARTGDPYWNAAQEEMIHTGMIHNYMRMYWCKQVSDGPGRPIFPTACEVGHVGACFGLS